MRPTFLFIAIVIAVASAQANTCRAASKTVGNWAVTSDGDPSSKTHTTSAKITDSAKGSLTIRCTTPGGLGVSIDVSSSKSYEPGATVKLDYGADGDALAEQTAKVVGPTSILISDPRQIVEDALRARTLHIRLQSPEGKSADLSFAPNGAGDALTQILLDCPSDLPVSR